MHRRTQWQVATGAFFAKLCQTCETESTEEGEGVGVGGLSRANMDFDVHPRGEFDSNVALYVRSMRRICAIDHHSSLLQPIISPIRKRRKKNKRTISPSDNFFLYSNGNWMRKNPIPSGYPSWNTFMSLRLKSQEDCKSILSELEGKLMGGAGGTGGGGGAGGDDDGDVTDEERKVALFYRAAMDEDAIEAAGTTPMMPLLELCEEAARCRDASSLGRMALLYGVTPFFSIGAGPDKKDSDRSIAQVSQGGIRLPDRDYYFDEDKEEQRVAYKRTMALMLTLLADPTAIEPSDEAIDAAGRVYALEKSLAECELRMLRLDNCSRHHWSPRL